MVLFGLKMDNYAKWFRSCYHISVTCPQFLIQLHLSNLTQFHGDYVQNKMAKSPLNFKNNLSVSTVNSVQFNVIMQHQITNNSCFKVKILQ